VELLEALEDGPVSGPGPFSPAGGGSRSVGGNGEPQKLALGGSAKSSRYPRTQEAYDREKHSIRRKPVPTVNPEHAPVQAQHHSSIGMGQNPVHVPETKRPESLRQEIFEQEALPGFPTSSLARWHQSP
jgi:hypothetical protein